MNIIEFLSQSWHWAASGTGIVFVMFLLLWFGGEFGASANLRTMCAIGGAGKNVSFFDFKWKNQIWNLVFIGSAIIGGYIATTTLASPEPVQIAASTQEYLKSVGISTPQTIEEGFGYVPNEIFGTSNFGTPRNLFLLLFGGFMVGFGARYAGGCTSGHAISGLANLQIPSLIAVVGFFIGGLFMAWIVLPQLLSL
ncbi:MAG: YeeE/YedE thiosulfate transporter family protein [Saprospiraceae bacterium]